MKAMSLSSISIVIQSSTFSGPATNPSTVLCICSLSFRMAVFSSFDVGLVANASNEGRRNRHRVRLRQRASNRTVTMQPTLSTDRLPAFDRPAQFSATGESFAIREWRGSGPAKLHVHHADDEAWHVLEGVLRFRFDDRMVDVGAGETVFVPAGVPHTYAALR